MHEPLERQLLESTNLRDCLAFNRSCSLPKSDCFQAANFGGLIPTESWSFSSEKSYSSSRLICCQDTTEPFAMAWNRISRAFRSPEALSSDATVWVQGRFEGSLVRSVPTGDKSS
jgi:hypothetical protein